MKTLFLHPILILILLMNLTVKENELLDTLNAVGKGLASKSDKAFADFGTESMLYLQE